MKECKICHLILDQKEFKYPLHGFICKNCYNERDTNPDKISFTKYRNKYIREEFWNAKIKLMNKDIYTSLVTLEDLKYLKMEGYSFIIKDKYL